MVAPPTVSVSVPTRRVEGGAPGGRQGFCPAGEWCGLGLDIEASESTSVLAEDSFPPVKQRGSLNLTLLHPARGGCGAASPTGIRKKAMPATGWPRRPTNYWMAPTLVAKWPACLNRRTTHQKV